MESLPVWKLFAVIFSLLALLLPLRLFLVRRIIIGQPLTHQSTRLLGVDFSLLVCAGLGTTLFNHLLFDFSLLSGGKAAIGFAAIGFLPALDLSLRWEHGIIAAGRGSDIALSPPQSYYPQTRKFAFLAAAIILFAGVVLLLILWHDMKWLMTQDDGAVALPILLRSVLWEVLFVMGILLLLILLVIASYARNLKLLFANQTKVLELVSRGNLESKVPVITNDEFAVIAGHTNVMIDHLQERERMARGLELASQIQANLLPRSSPHLPGIKIYGTSRFCDETGGDFYDYLIRDDTQGPELVVMIGDVTGHGVGSALLMTSVRAYLRASIEEINEPARVLTRSNQLICRDVAGSGLFVTVLLIFYNPDSGLARWVGAGHHPALFLPSGDVKPMELAGSDIPLGVDAHWRYQASSAILGPGLLYLGTDGIWEATDSAGRMFGKERLHQVMEENSHHQPEALVGRIFAEVDRFTTNASLSDDRTAVVARLETRG
jgi:sigma-B regulation protein RsbU (phosphoserine phosphatase)